LLELAGGAGAGLVFTPVPWRLVSDSALWTQNWFWLPKVPRGELTERVTNCTLCSGGCAVRARCAGGVPIGLWPAGEPLCPAGFVAHHLAFHPQRLRGAAATTAKAVEALRIRIAALKEREARELVAVLDLAPGRTASLLHRQALARLSNGVYVEPPVIEGATARAISALLPQPVPMALDLERTRTLLSVGTPIAEGWARPGRRRGVRLIQAESQRSHTAEVADEWLPIAAGSEMSLLLAITRVLIEDGIVSDLPGFETFRTAVLGSSGDVGISSERLRSVARTLAWNRHSAVVADGDPANGPYSHAVQAAAAAVNVLLGSVGQEGGFAPRAEVPVPPGWSGVPVTELESLQDGSVGVLIIDEPLPGSAVPWSLVERKLAQDALVAACTWSASSGRGRAGWMIPAPVFLEVRQDAGAAVDSLEARFRVSDALIPAPPGAMEAAVLLGRLTGEKINVRESLERRAAAFEASGKKANRPDGSVRPVKLLPPEWAPAAARACNRWPGWRPAAVSPLLAKLWQESDLKRRPGTRS
jgi:hypothetical protein